MYYILQKVKNDHLEMQAILKEIESCITNKMPREKVLLLLDRLSYKWNEHEEKEEKLFSFLAKNGLTIPVKKAIIQEHRELKGHWKVLRMFVWEDNKDKTQIALETDGRMLIDKFYRHMQKEELLFKEFEHLFPQKDF